MKNLESVIEVAMELANDNAAKVLAVPFVELAVVQSEEFQQAVDAVVMDGEEFVDELSEVIIDIIDEVDTFDASMIDSYVAAGKQLPIKNSPDTMGLIAATQLVAETRWTKPGEALLSHLVLALSSGGDASIISQYCDRCMVDMEDIFAELVKMEAEELGIEPSTGVDMTLMEGIGAMLGVPAMGASEKEIDWKKFVVDLTAKADEYKKPFIGRDDVINRMVQVLARMDKSNPILVGEPGVGKTEVTIGLAKMIAAGTVPKQIQDHTLYSVDLAGMIAGTKYRGEFEARLKALLEGVKDQNVILFFDEIHQIVGCGSTSGSAMDASNILKPYLTEGSIKFVGATTYKEFKDNIEKDSALMRRFQKVDVKEPTVDEAICILKGLKDCYAEYHGVTYTDKAIRAAVELTDKYVHERFLPDKAIDMIDEAGAAVSIAGKKKVDSSEIEDVLSKLCNIPKKTMAKDEFAVVNELSVNLRNKVFGQDEAVEQIVDAIKINKSGLGDDDKPIASFLFVGPTGTGKTEIAKQLAANLGIEFVRFDMSEYMEENSVSKLIGTSAGYVGYEDGGLLTEAIRKTPHCVLLLDEIEKANPAIFKSFLQVMDYGQLTDNKGRIADFRNCVIIMTSNAGASVAAKKSLGFGTSAQSKEMINTDNIKDAVKNLFSPEFRNRLTKTVVFNGINDEIGKMAAKKELGLLNDKLAKKNITATYTDACIAELVNRGVSPEYGAREIQRLVSSEIKKQFVDKILSGSKTKKYTVDYDGTNFTVKATKATKALVEELV